MMSEVVERLKRERVKDVAKIFSSTDSITLSYNWHFKGKEVGFIDIAAGESNFRTSATLPVFHDSEEARAFLVEEAKDLRSHLKKIIPAYSPNITGVYCPRTSSERFYGEL